MLFKGMRGLALASVLELVHDSALDASALLVVLKQMFVLAVSVHLKRSVTLLELKSALGIMYVH